MARYNEIRQSGGGGYAPAVNATGQTVTSSDSPERRKAIEKGMDNPTRAIFHPIQRHVKTAAFAHSRRNGQR